MVIKKDSATSDDRASEVYDNFNVLFGHLTALQEVMEDAAVGGKPGYSSAASMLALVVNEADLLRDQIKRLG